METSASPQRWKYWIVSAIPLVGGLLFYNGVIWDVLAAPAPGQLSPPTYLRLLAGVLPVLALLLAVLLGLSSRRWQPALNARLQDFTRTIDAIPAGQLGFWILLAAGLGMYTELMVIRLHASFFQLFGYFKNVSLLSCFLGLGIGYAQGDAQKPLTLPLALPFLALQIAFMYALRQFFPLVNVLLQNPIPEQLALGMREAEQLRHLAAVYGFLTLIFAANAFGFIPLGQLAARLMARQPKLRAYSWNLAGSLAGIALFYFLSFAWAPPYVWVLGAMLMLAFFLARHLLSLSLSALAGLLLIGLLNLSFLARQDPETIFAQDLYSPYQILTLTVRKSPPPIILKVNNVYYQRIVGTNDWIAQYELPYYFKPAPPAVLIVGSGMGNDVAAALHYGAQQIDAVEIDPAILEFGKSLHPQKPYQSPRVTAIVDDARSFIRQTPKKYDLIIYGLLDSHTLLSGMSSVRLDSFVYTVEAFREARAKLKPDGLLCLTFAILRPNLGRKIFLMLQDAFAGQSPLVYNTRYDFGYTFLIGEQLRKPALPQLAKFEDAAAVFASEAIRADRATDDWPFLYMPVRTYPLSYVLMIAILLGISFVFIRQLLPATGHRFSWPCFFLGAGFMLVETKGITELALVYGSTWVVVGVVIAAILLLAFLANVCVSYGGTLRPALIYGLLLVSLLAGVGLSAANWSSAPLWFSRLGLTLLLTLPLFFSGFAFSAELQQSASVAAALSANLFGAMVGGLLEYNSMYFGFRFLSLLALVMYALAWRSSLGSRN